MKLIGPRMPHWMITVRLFQKDWSLFSVVISLLLIFSHALMVSAAEANDAHGGEMNIGVIIDANSRSGKEEKTAMEIAVQDFNNINNSPDNPKKLFLHFKDSRGDPLRAASSAEELIHEKKVEVIVGMDTWEEAALVADIGKKAQVPVLSFATAAISPPLSQLRWPFLIRMASNSSVEMGCVAAIVRSYGWRRVTVISESDAYSSDSEQIVLLSEALRSTSTDIEHRLVLPSTNSLVDPKGFVIQELEKLRSKQPRVFVVLRLSVALGAHLFREAKQMGLMEKDSAWIVTDTITSYLHSFNSSFMLSLNGALGIKAYYENSGPLQDFSDQFRNVLRSEYLEEDKFRPGIHALRAYDCIRIVSEAMEKLHGDGRTPRMLLQNMLSSNFTGLSGNIRFSMGELSHSPLSRIINVIGNGYKELEFWSPSSGFSKNPVFGTEGGNSDVSSTMTALVNWPGDQNRVPRGWAMPTNAKPLNIGVPGRTSFEKFVKVNPTGITGFCIAVFKEVVQRVQKNYALPYNFSTHNCSYDELVDLVYNKTVDAVVGDMTILAKRMEHVEFTQPFAESGLSMIVPVKSESRKAWMFLKPFTLEMWLMTSAILIYTMFIVWFLEHRTNPHFRGRWNDQLGTALWFTFSSLFFAHRERLHSNFSRVVVVVWLFVVLILTSSYTASLSSMLTVQRLEPNVTDINWLRNTHQKIGCDGDSFVRKYLQNVLNFEAVNILNVSSEYRYPEEFETKNITAAFLEVPYAKAFLNQYCKGYTVTNPTYRFGGLAFIFQKGSPIAQDFSEAILAISEDGTLKRLEEYWFSPTAECLAARNATETESLGLQSFWGLYAITGGTSTICLLIFLVLFIKSFRHRQEECDSDITPRDKSVWNKAKELAHYFHDGKFETPGRSPMAAQRFDEERGSPNWVCVTTFVTPEHPQASSPSPEFEIQSQEPRQAIPESQIEIRSDSPAPEVEIR